MTTVAIISEYNPFHTGHLYQIERIRAEFGSDTAIIAIMSGNYTQRGEIAVMDKYKRAECAVRAGVDLVLEIPFPFSISSAELYARSGVKIATSIGADYLSFGSECGDVDLISLVARNMCTRKYSTLLKENLKREDYKSLGYPKIQELTYKSIFGEDISSLLSPNNILAIEYLKALSLEKSSVKPHTVKRLGAGYSDVDITKAEHQSASAIRKLMVQDFDTALNYVPNTTKQCLIDAKKSGQAPTDCERLSTAVITKLMLNPHEASCDIQDAQGGLYNRLKNSSFEANGISSLISLVDTKKYTTARIRRTVWYSFFGVTSSEVKELPRYTAVLGMNKIGQAILKSLKKTSGIPILTKPSSRELSDTKALMQKESCDKADMVFELTKPCPSSGNAHFRSGPFVMK